MIAEASFAEKLNYRRNLVRERFDEILTRTRPDIIVDVGSFNGDDLARLRLVYPDAEFHAFEASPENVNDFLLKRDDLGKAAINNAAVADVDGTVSFAAPVYHPGEEWKRLIGSICERVDDHPVNRCHVPSVRLDTYFAQALKDGKTFALWIDVEGSLHRVIAGAPQVLARTVALVAEVERAHYWSDQALAEENIAALSGLGFDVIMDSHTPEVSVQSDILCVNRSHEGLRRQR